MPTVALKSTGPHAADVTELLVDGVDIRRFTTGVRISAGRSCGQMVEIDIIAGDGLDIALSAAVTANVAAPPGRVVIAEPQPDGTTRYRTAASAVY